MITDLFLLKTPVPKPKSFAELKTQFGDIVGLRGTLSDMAQKRKEEDETEMAGSFLNLINLDNMQESYTQ